MNALGSLDWTRFLARPRLPSPSMEVLDGLYQQTILVSGAGGSIGSALTQRLGLLSPSVLLALDAAESRLYQLQQGWTSGGVPGAVTPVLGDLNDGSLLKGIFTRYAPRLVFHAAAFKHVPLLEWQPLAAIANNIFGTLSLARATAAHSSRIVLLSTDKAVEPSSIMGATKRVAEVIVLSVGGIVLRLGNVLGTRDSVSETFARQIAERKPLTVTDPAARRYFLTVDEAVNLLLNAAVEPDPPALLAPELPPPQFITELAHFMAGELAPGMSPEIDFIGMRPGDKETERFWSPLEAPRPAATPGMLTIKTPMPPTRELHSALDRLREAVDVRDLGAAIELLRTLVPDYTPSETVRALAGQRVSAP